MIRRDAWEVSSKTLVVLFAALVLNVLVERWLEPTIHGAALRWATAFALVQTTAVVCFSLSLLGRRIYAQWRESIYHQLRPAMRDRVLALAFEGETWASEVPSHGAGRHVLDESLAHILSTLKAPAKDRVARFAVERGFAAQWIKTFSCGDKSARKRAVSLLGSISPHAGNSVLLKALGDEHPAVRAEAFRAVLVPGHPIGLDRVAVDSVFRSVLNEPLLTRALLADDLKRHATFLLANTIPSVLEEATVLEAARCFEVLRAWKRAMPSFDIHPWLRLDHHPALTPMILALLPYVWTDDSVEQYLISALRSEDPDVRCAAAQAAGRLRLARLTPALADLLGADRRLAVAAATAIAQMGEAGGRYLESAVAGRDRNAAAVAMEALEHITVKAA